jgi:hypothetical protein
VTRRVELAGGVARLPVAAEVEVVIDPRAAVLRAVPR